MIYYLFVRICGIGFSFPGCKILSSYSPWHYYLLSLIYNTYVWGLSLIILNFLRRLQHLHPSPYIIRILSSYNPWRWSLLYSMYNICVWEISFDYSLDYLRRLQYWYSSVNITKLLQQPSVRKAELLSPF